MVGLSVLSHKLFIRLSMCSMIKLLFFRRREGLSRSEVHSGNLKWSLIELSRSFRHAIVL